jgi:hypothetical protein
MYLLSPPLHQSDYFLIWILEHRTKRRLRNMTSQFRSHFNTVVLDAFQLRGLSFSAVFRNVDSFKLIYTASYPIKREW